MRTLRADVGALVAPSMNGFITRETCTAAVVIPTIDADTDRGSMSNETRHYNNDANSNKDDTRKTQGRHEEGNRRQDREKDFCAALQPPTLTVAASIIFISLISRL